MAFKMKGHTLPGINQRMDKSSKPDGRAKSSAFQKDEGKKKEELNEFGETPEEYKQRMISMGLRKSDIQDEIDSKINKKASKKDKAVATKSGAPMKKAPTRFNPKLKAASKAGKLSGEFKKAVDNSPMPMKKSPMEKGGDGCGGNFKVNKPGTVVSRALKKAGGSVKRGLDDVVYNIKKGNKKRKNKRNTVTAKNKGGNGHIVRSSDSYN